MRLLCTTSVRDKRVRKGQFVEILTAAYLTREYVENQRSTTEIGRECGCTHTTVIKYLKNHSIPRRIPSAYDLDKHPTNAWKGYKCIPKALHTRHRLNAKRGGREFSITLEDMYDQYEKQNKICALSGRPLKFTTHCVSAPSLDRIDSSKGYTKENIQWVHIDINFAKQSLSSSEFIALCCDVVKFNTLTPKTFEAQHA